MNSELTALSVIVGALVVLATIAKSLHTIWKLWIKPVVSGIIEIREKIGEVSLYLPILEEISREFKSNSGHSLSDRINRIEFIVNRVEDCNTTVKDRIAEISIILGNTNNIISQWPLEREKIWKELKKLGVDRRSSDEG